MQHIVRLERGYPPRLLWEYCGPFDTAEEAEDWLKQNGFSQHRANLWLRSGKASLKHHGQKQEVGSLRAFVSPVLTLIELEFSEE